MATDSATPSSPAPQPEGVEISPVLLVVAIVAWAILSFGHGYGLELAGDLFTWAKTPGNLTEAGGVSGMKVLEFRMGLFFGSIALVAVGWVTWRLRTVAPRRVLDELVPWALWASLLYLVWTCFIVYATELVHFGQYAVVGILFHLALKGRHPQLAFLITVASGFVDEIWQHYGLHEWLLNDPDHIMDWSDPVLDGLGASGGILLFVTLDRLKGTELPDTYYLVKRAVAIAALLFLPLLLLDEVGIAKHLGHYIYFPFWGEYDNHKPTHWPMPQEGIPLCIAALLILGTLLEPRRRKFSQAAFLLLTVLMLLAINPYSRQGGMPVHEVVAHTQVPYTTTPIVIDGVLEEAWEQAVRVGPFVSTLDGADHVVYAGDQQDPLHPTYARLCWDQQYLYVAFEVSDPDIWARQLERDDRSLPADEVVEVFLDDGGDEVTYYEYEVSPLNVVYDLFNFIPFAPIDYDPDVKFIGLPQWSAPGLKTAVSIDGTVDVTTGWTTPPAADKDVGWTAELAIPWEELRTTTTPSGSTIRPNTFPEPGDRWRMSLFRVERPRTDLWQTVPADESVTTEEALELLQIEPRVFADMVRNGGVSPTNEAKTEFTKQSVLWQRHYKRAQFQAWAPTYSSSFHRPPRFGVIEFVKEAQE